MGIRIVELFGYDPADQSSQAIGARKNLECPFLRGRCAKTLNDGTVSGVCTVRQTVLPNPVICCPIRLYADNYRVLLEIARSAFGADSRLIPGQQVATAKHDGRNVAVFGKRWGKELRLPNRGSGGYFVDWILALIGTSGVLDEFVAVEVQAIDTTGNYRAERDAYMRGKSFTGSSAAGINWENVNKRILPQIIYKGHVLRREKLCKRGLFFVCPAPVYARIIERLGGTLLDYGIQPGSLTFKWCDVPNTAPGGSIRSLVSIAEFTTTIDQVAHAFTSPSNLPPAGVYQAAIEAELKAVGKHRG